MSDPIASFGKTRMSAGQIYQIKSLISDELSFSPKQKDTSDQPASLALFNLAHTLDSLVFFLNPCSMQAAP
jgi:hypothetical protein